MNRFDKLIQNLNTDALLVVGGSNILYATSFKADCAYVLYTKKGQYYLTDGRFVIEAKQMLSNDYQIIEIDNNNTFEVMTDILERDGVNSISLDEDISHYLFKEIEEALSQRFTLADVSGLMLETRRIKTSEEVDFIIKAQRIAEQSLNTLLPEIKLGMSEIELSARLEYLMRLNGSHGYSFSSIVAFGTNSAFAHARPSARKLAVGDIVLIDFGATYNGYCSDMTRTFAYGVASENVMLMHAATLDANETCIKAIKPGMTTVEIDGLARKALAKYRLDKYFTHSLGHGVGIDIHESPSLSPRGDAITLKEGMIVTIEPGVYVEGIGGVRIEDMVLITGDGATNLTKQDKRLTVLK